MNWECSKNGINKELTVLCNTLLLRTAYHMPQMMADVPEHVAAL
jgi:hypothetical protein